MNTGEGLRRIATVVRVIGWLGSAFMASAMLLTASESARGFTEWAVGAAMTVAPVMVAYGIAWVIDGFAAPREK